MVDRHGIRVIQIVYELYEPFKDNWRPQIKGFQRFMNTHVNRTLKAIGQLRLFMLYELYLLVKTTWIAMGMTKIFRLTHDRKCPLKLYANQSF